MSAETQFHSVDRTGELTRELTRELSDKDLKTVVDKAYLIIEGEVAVRKGKEEIARLGPGDVIGEMAIVGHKLRSASVVSLTPVEGIHFTKESLTELLDEVPAFGEALRGTTSDRLGQLQG